MYFAWDSIRTVFCVFSKNLPVFTSSAINPASDPEGDYDYASGGEEEPEKYIINEVLHSKIIDPTADLISVLKLRVLGELCFFAEAG